MKFLLLPLSIFHTRLRMQPFMVRNPETGKMLPVLTINPEGRAMNVYVDGYNRLYASLSRFDYTGRVHIGDVKDPGKLEV